MKKSLLFGSMLIVACLSVVEVEASNTEALMAKYAGQNVQAEYVLYHGSSAVKRYTYTKVGDNVCLKYDFIPVEEPKVDTNKKEDPVLPAETKKQMNKMNRIATALSSLSSQGSSKYLRDDYDLNVIDKDKIYFLDSETKIGKWANLGDVNKSKELWEILGGGTLCTDNFNSVNVIKDIIFGNRDRIKITLLKAYKSAIYSDGYKVGDWDIERIRVDNLSLYGRKTGYSYECELTFQDGELKSFTYPEYSKDIWLSMVYDQQKIDNPIFKIETLRIINMFDNSIDVDEYKLERIPLGW